VTDDGKEQITGFYLPGEIFGMDGIGSHRYLNSAFALETSAICEIPFARLEELSLKLPNLQHHFFRLMSREITQDHQLIMQLTKNSAEERVASLILSISSRNSSRNLAADCFYLSMSRSDIGNYLGLTIETVSRIFGRFQKQDIIQVNRREIVILKMDALRKLARVS
jgi:CRP/FNR family transcriptional regulator